MLNLEIKSGSADGQHYIPREFKFCLILV